MISDPSLAGQAILILEDDIVQAFDLEHVLSSVGARVVGPFSKECYAIEANRIGRLSAAIIDVNLGRGNSFETAHALQDAAVPFIFVTGYDPSTVPAEFELTPRFVKPIESRQLVRELARLLSQEPTVAPGHS